jgi:hypothetical protein
MQDKVHAPRRPGGACLEDVEGFTSASPRQSLTTGAGALRLDPIEGVRYRLARPVSHQHVRLRKRAENSDSLCRYFPCYPGAFSLSFRNRVTTARRPILLPPKAPRVTHEAHHEIH